MGKTKRTIPFLLMFVAGAAILYYGMSNMSYVPKIGGSDSDEQEFASKPKRKVIETKEMMPLGVNIEIRSGETLSGVLEEQGIDVVEVALAVEAISDVFDLRTLRAEQEIILELEEMRTKRDGVLVDDEEMSPRHIKKITFQPTIEQIVHLESKEKNEFSAYVEKVDLKQEYIKASGKIENSFYESLVNSGVTDNVTLQLIAALSFAVDFQRDIQPDDEFEILYQAYTKDNEIIKGRIPAYVRLKMQKEEIELYVLENKDGSLGYYYPDAVNVKKGLLRTPINGARISSGFGNRMHPILGYSKLHTGVDFAAPTGTPIYAAGDGVINYAAPRGTFGNYVQIRHNQTYETAYAHASRFGKGIRGGIKVRQGQVIAYVGTTGRSTGPHLHYEVHKNGTPINPQNADLNIVRKLEGQQLVNFRAKKAEVEKQLKTAPSKADLAERKAHPPAVIPAPIVPEAGAKN